MSYYSFDHFFMTLGNKQRVRILQLLVDKGPLSVTAIAETLKVEQSSVSHNLKNLLLCHFVAVTQEGKERIYVINGDTVKPLFDGIERHVKKYCVKGCDHWE
jgi:ArsR family transcriptional regulator